MSFYDALCCKYINNLFKIKPIKEGRNSRKNSLEKIGNPVQFMFPQ